MKKYYVRKMKGTPILGPWSLNDLIRIKHSKQIADSWEAIEDNGAGPDNIARLENYLWIKVADVQSKEIPLRPGQWYRISIDGELIGPLASSSFGNEKSKSQKLDWLLVSQADTSASLSSWRPACLLSKKQGDNSSQLPPPQGMSDFLSRFEGAVIGIVEDNAGTIVAKRLMLSTADMMVLRDIVSLSALIIPHHRIDSIAVKTVCIPLSHRDVDDLHSANGLSSKVTVDVPLIISLKISKENVALSQVLIAPTELPNVDTGVVWGVGFGVSVPLSF